VAPKPPSGPSSPPPGNDLNACTPTAPCRGFTRALAVVDAGGEIVALDAAGYGTVSITKSVTITANPGVFAGISAATGDAVQIVAPDVTVILRNLSINAVGATNGINVADVADVVIENCVISNFQYGVRVPIPANVRILDSTILNNQNGVHAMGGAFVDVSRSRLTGNLYGVYASGDVDGTNTRMSISDTIASGNSRGFVAETINNLTGNVTMSVTRSTASNGNYGIYIHRVGGNNVGATLSGNLVTHNTISGIYNGAARSFLPRATTPSSSTPSTSTGTR
jgi:hypothetical protein